MKKLILFIITSTLLINGQAQNPVPDSLIGLYAGTMYHVYGNNNWTLTQDTIIITTIDTSNCELIIKNFFFNGNEFDAEYSTAYTFCEIIIDPDEFGFYPFFHSDDSIEIIYERPQPFPFVDLEKNHFKGKHIPGSTIVNINTFIKDEQILIYPNPAKSILTIGFPNDNSTVKITIRDIFGKIVFGDQCDSKEIKIDLIDYNAGIYILQWENEFISGYSKFLIEK